MDEFYKQDFFMKIEFLIPNFEEKIIKKIGFFLYSICPRKIRELPTQLVAIG
jgi:hypothetical protein